VIERPRVKRTRNLGEIISDTFSMYFAHWSSMLLIAVPLLAVSVISGLVATELGEGIVLTGGTPERPELSIEIADRFWLFLALFGLLTIAGVFFNQVESGATVVALDQVDDVGRPRRPLDAWMVAWRKLGSFLGAWLRMSIIACLLAITSIGVPFVVHRFVAWTFVQHMIMLEGKRAGAALEASKELVRGRWWNTLGRLIVVWIVVWIIVALLTSATSRITDTFPGLPGIVLSGLVSLAVAPVNLIALTLMYFDLKLKKGESVRAPVVLQEEFPRL
jgi:hypothetical protein